MAIIIDAKRFQKELSKLKPVDIGQLNEKSQRLRTLFLVLAGDKRVINELSLEGMADLFNETPEILSLYDLCTEDYFDASKLVDYKIINGEHCRVKGGCGNAGYSDLFKSEF